MLRKWISVWIVTLVILEHINCQESFEEIKELPIEELRGGLEDALLGKSIGIKEYLKQQQQDQEKISKKPSFEDILIYGNYTTDKKSPYQNLQKIQNFLESQGLLSSSRFGSHHKSEKQKPFRDDGNNRPTFSGEGRVTKSQYRHVWMDMLKETYKILKDKSLLANNKNGANMMEYLFNLLNDIDVLDSYQDDHECPSVYNKIGNLCLSLDFLDTFLDFEEARLYCQVVKGGDLAMFRNADEFADIQRYIKLLDPGMIYSYWLGITDEEIENEWKFIDGRIVPFGAPYWGVSFDYCDFINNTCSINNATCTYWNTTCTASNATCGNYSIQCDLWKPLCNTFYPTCTGWNNYTTNNCLITNNTCVTWKANCTSWYSTCYTLYYNCYDYDDYIRTCDNSTGACLSQTLTCAKWNVSCGTFYPSCTGYNDYSVSCNRVNTTCINWRNNCSSWHHTCHEFKETCWKWNKTCTASNSTCGQWNISCSQLNTITPMYNAPCATWDDLDEPCIPYDRQLQPEFNNTNENYALLLNIDLHYLHDANPYEAAEWNTIPLCQFIPERDMDNFQYGVGVWEDWNDDSEFKGWYNHEKEKYTVLSQSYSG